MDCQEYKVGRFVLQPYRQLLDGAIAVSAGRKALELLSVLCEAGGALVTKDELMAAVWPNAVVEDNALQVHIASLRRLLHADAGLLSTVHGFGYRLAASPVAASGDRQAGLRPVMNPAASGSWRGGQTSLPGRKRTRQAPLRFQPGPGGNPGGNPGGSRGATYREVVRLAQKCSERAVLRLAELTQSGDERIALLASQALLERAYGKTREFIDLPPAEATAAAASATNKIIQKRSQAAGQTCGALRDMPDIRRYPL
jgi:DNA-binding winged helix-turn-helix (wHTH) protein